MVKDGTKGSLSKVAKPTIAKQSVGMWVAMEL